MFLQHATDCSTHLTGSWDWKREEKDGTPSWPEQHCGDGAQGQVGLGGDNTCKLICRPESRFTGQWAKLWLLGQFVGTLLQASGPMHWISRALSRSWVSVQKCIVKREKMHQSINCIHVWNIYFLRISLMSLGEFKLILRAPWRKLEAAVFRGAPAVCPEVIRSCTSALPWHLCSVFPLHGICSFFVRSNQKVQFVYLLIAIQNEAWACQSRDFQGVVVTTVDGALLWSSVVWRIFLIHRMSLRIIL